MQWRKNSTCRSVTTSTRTRKAGTRWKNSSRKASATDRLRYLPVGAALGPRIAPGPALLHIGSTPVATHVGAALGPRIRGPRAAPTGQELSLARFHLFLATTLAARHRHQLALLHVELLFLADHPLVVTVLAQPLLRLFLLWPLERQDIRHLFLPGHRNTPTFALQARRSEEHTSELQSREKLVCRLLLEKKTQYHDI